MCGTTAEGKVTITMIANIHSRSLPITTVKHIHCSNSALLKAISEIMQITKRKENKIGLD
jgi:hypothetical protein